MSTKNRIEKYSDFWPYYLREHSQAKTRALHYFGTSLGLILLTCSLLLEQSRLVWGALFCGYFFAWTGHFFIEKNRPATFQYPFWSLISDFRMFYYFVTKKMDTELRKAGVGSDF